MGNYASCILVESQEGRAKLVDLHGHLIRNLNLPMAAAELMLEEPGHVVSAVDVILSTSRFSAMKADDQISVGKVYVLVPLIKLHTKLSEPDKTMVDPGSLKRCRSARVLPALAEGEEQIEDRAGSLVRVPSTDNTRVQSCRVKQWRPSLECISEV